MNWTYWKDFDEQGDTLDFCIGPDESDPQLVTLCHGRPGAEALAKKVVLAVNSHASLVNNLTRLTEKVERANALQHAGGVIESEDWAELYQMTNDARAALAKAKGEQQ